MPHIRPFTGLLYDPTVAGPSDQVSAPPYDVISPIDQDRYYRMSPHNVVRLILGRDEPGDDDSTNKYTRAASTLETWIDEGALKPTPRPALFPYEFDFHLGGMRRRVRGVIAEVDLEPSKGAIVPHERTMPGPMEDRLRLIRAVRSNLSPVYGVLSGPGDTEDLAAFLDEATIEPSDREATDEAGTRHRLWIWDRDPESVTDVLERRPLMIADGHHRYKVALAYRDEMRRRRGPGPWDSMMILLVDSASEDPPVLPIHRVLYGADPPVFRGERVRDLAEVLATLRDEDLTYGTVHIEDGEVVHQLATLEGRPPTVCALHEQILDRMRQGHLGFESDAVAAESRVLSEGATAAFLLPPTSVERVWDVVSTGERLPQKSTFFWPKPRTGMVFRRLST